MPHGEIKVSTDRDPSADRIVTIGPAGAHVELVVQLTAATVIVRVVDGDNNDQPLDGANVRLTTSDGAVRTGTTSGAPPQAAFAAVLPAGAAAVRATMTGYLPNTVPATIPASGTAIIIVRLHRDVAVQTPTAFVMQLDWGAAPRDLDLHCSGPDNAGGRFHCLFNTCSPYRSSASTSTTATPPAPNASPSPRSAVRSFRAITTAGSTTSPASRPSPTPVGQ